MHYHASHTKKHGHIEKTEKLKSHDLEGAALSKLCAVLNSIPIPSIHADNCDGRHFNPSPLCKALRLIQTQIEEHCD